MLGILPRGGRIEATKDFTRHACIEVLWSVLIAGLEGLISCGEFSQLIEPRESTEESLRLRRFAEEDKISSNLSSNPGLAIIATKSE